MNLQILNTELLLDEMKTDGHAPLKFICDSGDIYFCKYLKSISRSELNCLAYEVVASFLLRSLEVPTPEIALVKISPSTLIKEKIKYNRRLQTGNICFGSKEIKFSTELQALQHNIKKKDFTAIANPEDLIKIAIFDLWVLNMDRGKNNKDGEINYNLLLQPEDKKQRIIAFDHSFIFGGVQQIGTFNPQMGVSAHNTLIQTPYYKNTIKHIEKGRFISIVEEFVSLLRNFDQAALVKLIESLHSYWTLSFKLEDRIINLLTNKNHIKTCKDIIINSKR